MLDLIQKIKKEFVIYLEKVFEKETRESKGNEFLFYFIRAPLDPRE